MMGPLEYMVIGFDGDRISPEIVREIDEVRNAGTVRMLDLMIIAKDAGRRGEHAADVRPDGGRRPGARDGRRRPGRRAHQLRLALRGRHGFGRRHHAGLLVGDRDALRARRGPRGLRAAIIDGGGILLAEERIPPEAAAEVEAMLGRKA